MLTTSQPVAATSKEFSVKLPKIRAQYGIIEFASGFSIDIKDWKAIDMKREVNPCTYRSAVDINHNVSSASTLFTTSLGIVLSKTGAGRTNIEDFPWLLTTHSSTEKNLKHYQGLKKGGAPANSSYYIFIQNKDGFEAYSLEDWYAFTSTKHKHLSKWFLQHQIKKEHDNDEKENKSKTKKKHSFKLLDCEDWINDHEENEDENETSHTKVKNRKTTQSQTNRDLREQLFLVPVPVFPFPRDEIDYTSDETSNDEDDIKGLDEEMKIMRNIGKKMKQMIENESEFDFDHDDEDISDLDENDEKNDTITADNLSNVGKLLKNDAVSQNMESSSDDDNNLDQLDDLKKEPIESISSSIYIQSILSEQIKTGKYCL
ncbi:unnamed protein product [Rotaria sp. Silwood1]|nr:unnamed protein product [Rotaria sp. Silwood1]